MHQGRGQLVLLALQGPAQVPLLGTCKRAGFILQSAPHFPLESVSVRFEAQSPASLPHVVSWEEESHLENLHVVQYVVC